MKILFINFNLGSTAGINNGLAVLSAVLKEKGHQVKLIFLCEELAYSFDIRRIRQDIMSFNPDVIGMSLIEPQFKYMVNVCHSLQDYYKGYVICGGPHTTMDPEGVLSVKGVDAVCVGEGEDALSEFIEALEMGKDYMYIRNLWFKSHDGKIIRNRLRTFKDLNKLPPDDKELFDLDKIIPLKGYQLEVLLGRGCPYQCTYCINWSYVKKYKDLCERPVNVKEYIRVKNSDIVIQEIKKTVAKHPKIKKIAFVDDDFLAYGHFIEDFIEKYTREIRLPFIINCNPATFNIFKIELLKEAGCDSVRFGVESGSDRIRKDILKRPISNRIIIDALRKNNELGLISSIYIMIGLPTETKDEIFETLKLCVLTMPDIIKTMTFYPFKNTPIYNLCADLNLIDYAKKNILDSYDTFTCLRFPEEHQLFLRKIQTAFNWYINIVLDNDTSQEYHKLVNEIEKMNEDEWSRFDFYAVDRDVSQKFAKKGSTHYAKHVNRSLAVRMPSKASIDFKIQK